MPCYHDIYHLQPLYFIHFIIQCMLWLCTGSDQAKDTNGDSILSHDISGKNFIGVVYFVISLFFCLLFLGLFVTAVLFRYSKHYLPKETEKSMDSSTSIRDYQSRLKKKTISGMLMIIIVIAVLYPIMWFLCTIFPGWWCYLTKHKIQQYQLSKPPQNWGMYWLWQYSGNYYDQDKKLVIKLFPDILIYYGYIYFVIFMALLAKFIPSIRIVFHTRPQILQGFCIGEICLFIITCGMLIGQYLYWSNLHVYRAGIFMGTRTSSEIGARSMGGVANVVIGLLLLPISKNNVWSILFGVSWETMLMYHRFLGYTFMIIVGLHMFLWWYAYAEKGVFPGNILRVPPLPFDSTDSHHDGKKLL